MKISKYTLGSVAALTLFVAVFHVPTVASEELTAQQLMQRNYEAGVVKDSKGVATMTLTAANGQVRKRDLVSWTRQRDGAKQQDRVTKFESPPDVRGMASLLRENDGADDDVWVYLPALKKTRRVIADQKKDSFMGSDLSYGDVVGYRVAEWEHALGDAAEVDGTSCRIVISTPRSEKTAKQSGYSKRESCLDPNSGQALLTRTWDRPGNLLKEIRASDLRQVDGANNKWHAMKIHARNVQANTSTLIEIKSETINSGLSADLFRSESLETLE